MNVKKLFDLTGRVAIVSGGSMGLGLQMAESLAEMGANLVPVSYTHLDVYKRQLLAEFHRQPGKSWPVDQGRKRKSDGLSGGERDLSHRGHGGWH